MIFSTAAVWCLPFCLDCSVPWVYAINFKRKKKDTDAHVRWNLRDDYLRISVRTAAGGHAAGAASVSLTPTNAPSCAFFQDDRCSGDAEFGRAP